MGHDLFRKSEDHCSGSYLWSKPPLGFWEMAAALTPERHADLHGVRRYADRRLTQDIAFRYRAASGPEHKVEMPEVNAFSDESMRKLNIFAQSGVPGAPRGANRDDLRFQQPAGALDIRSGAS